MHHNAAPYRAPVTYNARKNGIILFSHILFLFHVHRVFIRLGLAFGGARVIAVILMRRLVELPVRKLPLLRWERQGSQLILLCASIDPSSHIYFQIVAP